MLVIPCHLVVFAGVTFGLYVGDMITLDPNAANPFGYLISGIISSALAVGLPAKMLKRASPWPAAFVVFSTIVAFVIVQVALDHQGTIELRPGSLWWSFGPLIFGSLIGSPAGAQVASYKPIPPG